MDNLIALAAATAVLVLVPGPNVALIVATSLQQGRRAGLVTVAGTTLGVGLQLLLVVGGYSALIAAAASALAWIKWLGVVVLVVLGIRAWREAGRAAAREPMPRSRTAFTRGVLLAIVNPKTLLFNAAFLPQFVGSAAAAGSELPLIAGVYLAVIAAGDCGWVLGAGAARRLIERHVVLHRRLAAAFLIGAGGALAATRVDRP